MTTTLERRERKILEGIVLSDKMDKTRVIEVMRTVRHRRYGKVLSRSSKLYAHDEKNESHTGDRVSVMETRPLSKNKRWRLLNILEKARVGVSVDEALGQKTTAKTGAS